MANDNTFDPSQDIGRQGDKQLGNPAVSSPFEPGSVNKIVAASAVIEHGLSSPDEVLQVPGSIQMGGVTVHDAWEHGVMPYTTTGCSKVLQRRHADAFPTCRTGTLLRYAPQVRVGTAHRRGPAR